MKLSLAVLNTSSIRLFFNIRLIHTPDIRRRIYPVVSVTAYMAALTVGLNGRSSIHQFMKNSTSPERKAAYILFQVIFSFFTPFVPRHESARNMTAKTFVISRLLNNPAVRWKLSSILSTTPILIPISTNDR